MSRPTITVGSAFLDQFAVYEPDGVTKVTGQTVGGGDFTVSIWRAGAVYGGPATATIAEIGTTGEYSVTLTPDVAGYWKIQVYVAYNAQNWDFEFDAAVAGSGGGGGGGNDQTTEPVQAVIGRQVRLTWYEEDSDGDPETGLVIGSFTPYANSNGSVVVSPLTALSASFLEVSSGSAPGEYQMLLTPTEEGTLVFRLDRGTRRIRWVIRVDRRGIIDLSTAMVAGSSRVQVKSLLADLSAIGGALVKVYDATGTTQVARGTTDSSGILLLDLAPGTYKVYVSKTGFSFSTSGTSIVVPAGDEEAPVIEVSLPSSVAATDRLVLSGRFFHLTTASNTVVFDDGSETTVAASDVDASGNLLLVTVPAGLTAGLVSVSVRKPHPTSGTLTSNIVQVTAT